MSRLMRVLGMLVLAGIVSAPAHAAPLTIFSDTGSSTEGIATYTGLFSYDQSSATLSVTIDHTSSSLGYLTGIAFLNPGGITGVTFSSSDADFQLIGGPTFQGGISGSPFGDFDIGASLSSSWLGSGNPHPGVASGSSATFTFVFAGTGLASLTELDFVQAAAAGEEWFVARFRGFPEPPTAGSDKVPADYRQPPTSVPEPATMLLLGIGGAAAIVRRRQLLGR